MLVPFLAMSFVGAAATERLLIGAVVFITWWSGLDYLKQGFPAVARAPAHRALHWLRLGAGALLPVVVMAALAVPGLPTIPLVVLLASDMARGALDNFAANQGVADFSWAASMWGELGPAGGGAGPPGGGEPPLPRRRADRGDRDAAQPGPVPAGAGRAPAEVSAPCSAPERR